MQRKFVISNDICYIFACYVKSFCENNEFLLKKLSNNRVEQNIFLVFRGTVYRGA